MVMKQLISVNNYTKKPYGLYCPRVSKDINKHICERQPFQTWLLWNYTEMFYEINNGTEPAYEDATKDDIEVL